MKISTLNGTVTINAASNANPVQFTASASIVARIPVGSTTQMTISGLTGAWAAANGTWVATPVDTTHFTVPLDSTALGAWSGGTNVTSVKGLDVCGTGSAQCDYNAGYGVAATLATCTDCTNQGRSYAGAWTTTMGSMTLIDTTQCSPLRFENSETSTRCYWVIRYERRSCLEHVRIRRLHQQLGYECYQNGRFNFRCVDAVGCTSDPRPAVDSGARMRDLDHHKCDRESRCQRSIGGRDSGPGEMRQRRGNNFQRRHGDPERFAVRYLSGVDVRSQHRRDMLRVFAVAYVLEWHRSTGFGRASRMGLLTPMGRSHAQPATSSRRL